MELPNFIHLKSHLSSKYLITCLSLCFPPLFWQPRPWTELLWSHLLPGWAWVWCLVRWPCRGPPQFSYHPWCRWCQGVLGASPQKDSCSLQGEKWIWKVQCEHELPRKAPWNQDIQWHPLPHRVRAMSNSLDLAPEISSRNYPEWHVAVKNFIYYQLKILLGLGSPPVLHLGVSWLMAAFA